jgi:hypothetical protein
MHACTHTGTHAHTYTRTHTRARTNAHTHTHTHTHMQIRTRAQASTQIPQSIAYINPGPRTGINAHAHISRILFHKTVKAILCLNKSIQSRVQCLMAWHYMCGESAGWRRAHGAGAQGRHRHQLASYPGGLNGNVSHRERCGRPPQDRAHAAHVPCVEGGHRHSWHKHAECEPRLVVLSDTPPRCLVAKHV